ncbi:MAG: hypothetical protein KBA55_07505 [Ruminococcus sp.]|nr:hypothetical protein [Ruminococcus sp.]
MYDKAMSAAVDTAQRRLMNTSGSDSVLMATACDLKELCDLTEKLDPSGINFDKGGLEKLKINSYWSRFEKNYPAMKALFEKLVRSKKILFNSRTTINKFYNEYSEAYEKFKAVPQEEQDDEYIQQAVIAENMYHLMKNSVSEHELFFTHLDKVINILDSSMDMAIYLARKSTGSSIGDYIKATPVSVTNSDYQDRFRDLNNLLNNDK